MSKLIHKDLTYAIRGTLFDVHNSLGPELPEAFYQSAMVIGLERKGIIVQAEKEFAVNYKGVQVGRYYVDLWVENGKVLLELKVATGIDPIHEAQAISYLKVTEADLAIIANFGQKRLQDKRVPNFLRPGSSTFTWDTQQKAIDTLYPELIEQVMESLHRVHFELGTGFLHQIYRRATMVEFQEAGIGFRYIKKMPVYFQDQLLGNRSARVISIDDKILLATLAVNEITDVARAKMELFLKTLEIPLGLIANFHGSKLKVHVVRMDGA